MKQLAHSKLIKGMNAKAYTPNSDQKKMTVKLHSLFTGEPADFSAKLNIEKLQKDPVKAENQGNKK
ncbi:hypothetical protein JNUCC42_09225 [Brevibacterium sp. JNUCC-42]|nr:hypothetical protein JNUCC42_09225 [Brevibacterium sp. JNUCC-42]